MEAFLSNYELMMSQSPSDNESMVDALERAAEIHPARAPEILEAFRKVMSIQH